MTSKPIARIPEQDLCKLLSALEVEVVFLSECLASPGYALDMGGHPSPGIHYCLEGGGRLTIGNKMTVELTPHTLIVVPPQSPFRIEGSISRETPSPTRVVDGRLQRSNPVEPGKVKRFSAGDEPGGVILICGFFRAFYGSTLEIFSSLPAPIVERFGEADRLDAKLKEALAELVAEEVGAGVMSAALLKQVIVRLLRRALSSANEWGERFALLKDSNIMRAFAEMAAHPGAAHSVESLAQVACLSRSAFMSRFTGLLGRPPMDLLRELRMRQAARQLETGLSSIEQVAHDAGYLSRSSFARAFAKAYGREPVSGEA